MKKIFILICLLISVAGHTQNQRVGVGSVLGEPTGFSIKIWRSDAYDFKAVVNHFEDYAKLWIYSRSFWLPKKHAWDFCLAVPVLPEGNFHIHCDYLTHFYRMLPPNVGMMPVYCGIGWRLRGGDDADLHLGLRFVTGVDYFIPRVPVDVFWEVAPIIDFKPDWGLDINIGMGIRYNF